MENTDRLTCSKYFDLRLSTDTFITCTNALEKEYQEHVKNMRVNSSLRAVLNDDYATLVKKLFAVDIKNFSREIFNIDTSPFYTTANDTFIEFMK
jgi:hypothetical protein